MRYPNRAMAGPILALSVALSLGCGGDGSTGPPTRVPIASVTVDPDSARLDVGDTLRLVATARDRFDRVLSDREFTWTTTDAQVASVDSAGLVRALRAGFVSIMAMAGIESDAATLVVIGPLADFEVKPSSVRLLISQTSELTAVLLDAAGNDLSDRFEVTWSSTNPGVVEVVPGDPDESSQATAVGEGSASVIAAIDTLQATATVDVRAPIFFAGVSAGMFHGCGRSTDSLAYCWGINDRGQVGVGDDDAPVPVELRGLAGVIAVSAGGAHSCAITTTMVFCWGANDRGQVGDGTTQDRNPVEVAAGLDLVSITTGGQHTCGVTSGGAAYCWGANDRGQVGDGSTTDRTTPTLVSGGLTWTEVVAGAAHTCGITSSDEAYCWGANERGQLGDGTTTDRVAPTLVTGGLTWGDVSAGVAHSCGVTTGGEAYCWGANDGMQLGDGSTDDSSDPVAVTGGLAFDAISAGALHSCGLVQGDTAYCWGTNELGQLGTGNGLDQPEPTAVFGDLPFVDIDASLEHTCGLTSEPRAYCWGITDDRLGGPSSFRGFITEPGLVTGQLPP